MVPHSCCPELALHCYCVVLPPDLEEVIDKIEDW